MSVPGAKNPSAVLTDARNAHRSKLGKSVASGEELVSRRQHPQVHERDGDDPADRDRPRVPHADQGVGRQTQGEFRQQDVQRHTRDLRHANRFPQGDRRRQQLGILCFLAVLCGAMLGFLVLRNQPLEIRLFLIALASGFLITTVAQTMIPEANRDGEPSFAAIMYVAGLSIYAFVTLSIE